ncbi:MAG: prepilin-type N-terminal cleavage/methylation domain-containing protein [Gemmatimonadota bacterium]
MRHGLTLVELVAALAVLSVGLGVASVALASLRTTPDADLLLRLRRARAEAVRTGRPVPVRAGALAVLFAPDGSASTSLPESDSLRISVDPLTGAVRAVP